jgi:hypothetical protein
MLSSCIRKRKTRAAAKRDEEADDPSECPVCYYDPNEKESPCTKFEAFPCTHKVCDACFPKLSECPICRTAKDGTPGSVRQEREERERADARTRQAPVEMVVFFRGGGGVGDGPEAPHPFSAETTGFRVAGLPPGLMRVLPELLSEGLAFNRQRQNGRQLTVGQRQQTASEVLRFAQGSLHIEDLLGRRVRGSGGASR